MTAAIPTGANDTEKVVQAIADMQASTVRELKSEMMELRKLIEAQTVLIEAKVEIEYVKEEVAAAVVEEEKPSEGKNKGLFARLFKK